MALFDLPRLHFRGTAEINPSTLNNSATWPLVLYDTIRSEPFLPPRLYFHSRETILNVRADISPTPHEDPTNGFFYIEIDVLKDVAEVHKWCKKRLCHNQSAVDWQYRPYYDAVVLLYQNQSCHEFPPLKVPLLDQPPAYWNMFGDMSVTLSTVDAVGVQRLEDSKGGPRVVEYEKDDPEAPAVVQQLMNLRLDFHSPAARTKKAVICDTIGNQAIHTYIFCSGLQLTNRRTGADILRGTPFRFAPLSFGAWKVLAGLKPPMASAARFCSAIPLEEMEVFSEELKSFLEGSDERELRGVFVSLTLEQTLQNRDPEYYETHGDRAKPAKSTVVATLAPWYAGDLRSNVLGRQLATFNAAPPSPKTESLPLGTMMSGIREFADGSGLFSVDLAATWPERMEQSASGVRQFSTYGLGEMSFRYGDDLRDEFFNITVNEAVAPLDSVFARGSLFDCFLSKSQVAKLKDEAIRVYLGEDLLFRETDYYITSDTKGLYGEAGEAPQAGYRVYDAQREPCILRILQRGRPVTRPIDVHMGVYRAPGTGNNPLGPVDRQEVLTLKDGDAVPLVTNALRPEDTGIYYFAYDGQYADNRIPPFAIARKGYTIQDTSAFVTLNVVNNKDYSRYLSSANWNRSPPTWEVVYQEVFKLYHMLFPAMGKVIPFEQGVYEDPYVREQVVALTDPALWNRVTYMPPNRILSKSQRELILAWSAYVQQRDNPNSDYPT